MKRVIIIHITVLIVQIVLFEIFVKSYMPFFYFSDAYILILIFFILNLSANIILQRSVNDNKGEKKAATFRVIVVRGIRFILYLFLSLAFIQALPKEKYIPFASLLMLLFVIYTGVEFKLFRRK